VRWPWPLTARAQQPAMPVVGYLSASTAAGSSEQTSAFVQRLRELGWVEGRNIVIEYRWAQGRAELATEFLTEFIRRRVDIIVTVGNEFALLAKRATSVIPIVFVRAGDPIGTGLIESLARPGGNITGFSTQLTDTAAKRVDLLHKVVPGLRRLAVLAAVVPESALEIDTLRTAAGSLGAEVKTFEIRKTGDISLAFDGMKGQADALCVANSALTIVNQSRILTLALTARLPTVFSTKNWTVAGGLMSYGADFPNLWRRSAELVDKILRGTNPSDIPVEQASKFELAVNLVTAKALGLTIPDTFLLLADEVIE
jgi:putative tryptophan/tyrosine transport system substrate-binding protein